MRALLWVIAITVWGGVCSGSVAGCSFDTAVGADEPAGEDASADSSEVRVEDTTAGVPEETGDEQPEPDTEETGGDRTDTRAGDPDTGEDPNESDTGCDPQSCGELGAECGNVTDGCGNELDCGTCDGATCDLVKNQCLCTPKTPDECATNECGSVSDGCGGTVDCGSCEGTNDCDEENCQYFDCGQPGQCSSGTDCGGCPDLHDAFLLPGTFRPSFTCQSGRCVCSTSEYACDCNGSRCQICKIFRRHEVCYTLAVRN